MVATASAAMRQVLRDRQILDAVGTGAAALSLVGSSFIVLCYLLFRELRKFSFKLVFYLAVSVSGLLPSWDLVDLRGFGFYVQWCNMPRLLFEIRSSLCDLYAVYC